MANKNKNNLVPATDEDLITEFELPAIRGNRNRNFETETEVDEQTYSIDDTNVESTEQSTSANRRVLRSQARVIEELSFDVEQLRARRRGLEEELRAREEITVNLNRDIRDSKKGLCDAVREVESKKIRSPELDLSDAEIEALRALGYGE